MYNFVIPDGDPGDLQVTQITDVDLAWKAFHDGKWCWTLQSYLILREYIAGLTYSREPIEGAINLVHGGHVTELKPRGDVFLVCLRADYRRCPWAHIHIVQNQNQVVRSSDYYVPHWPQPGLIARCAKRKGVRCIAFAGRGYYLAGGESRWSDVAGERGFDFRCLDASNWNDFSAVDIAIGIRSFDQRTYETKPPVN